MRRDVSEVLAAVCESCVDPWSPPHNTDRGKPGLAAAAAAAAVAAAGDAAAVATPA